MKRYIIMVVLSLCMLFNFKIMAQGTWTKKADFNGIIAGYGSAFSIGTKGYVFIGFNYTVKYTNAFSAYNPLDDKWTNVATFAGAGRANAVGFSIGNKGYIAIGDSESIYRDDMWEYDPTEDKWTQKASFPGTVRYYAKAFSIGNKAYIGFGINRTFNNFNDMWEYDPLLDKWTQKASFPVVESGNKLLFVIGNKGYIYTNNDIWEYDPIMDSWAVKTTFPGQLRYAPFAFVLNNKVYFGTGNDANTNLTINDFWEYNAIKNTWKQLPNFPSDSRSSALSFTIGNKGYVTSGLNDASEEFIDLWEYSPDGVGVKEITTNTQHLTIYPNPANELITIGFLNTENSLTNLVIKDLLGNTIKEIFANKLLQSNNYEYTCQTNNLANGIYMVCLTNEAGLQVSKKIIIAK